MKKRLAIVLALTMSLSMASVNVAAAEPIEGNPWEDGETVTFEIAARAGGGTDLMVRYVTSALSELYPNVNFVVQNYDVSEVGIQTAANAEPDGLTLTCLSVGNKSGYLAATSETDPEEAFAIVARFTPGGPQALVASVDDPFNTLDEMADYIRENPHMVNIGVSLGAVSHFAWLETFNAIDPELNNLVNYVQSGGEADKLTNIASNSLDLVNCSLNNAIAYESDGKLKVLATIGPEVAVKAEIETLLNTTLADNYLSLPEQGVAYTLDCGSYFAVPADTDPSILETLNQVLQGLEDSQTYIDGLHAMGSFTGVDDLATSQQAYADECAGVTELMNNLGMNMR